MKQIGYAQKVTRANAWGKDHTYLETTFEVEESDVGKARENYLGFGRPAYQFKPSDAGSEITIQSSPGWTCWYFR